MYKTLSAPISAHVELTSRCTNLCEHCYNYWRNVGTTIAQPIYDWKVNDIINLIDILADAQVLNVLFTGGEPTLVRKTLLAGLSHAIDRGLGVALNSNLVPITATYAKELKSVGLNSVLTSVLGPSSQTHDAITNLKDSWKKVVSNITLLQNIGISVNVSMVISQSNKHLIEDTVRLLCGLNVNSIHLTRASCPGNCSDFSHLELTLEDFRAYLQEAHRLEQEFNIQLGALECYPLCGVKDLYKHKSILGRRCVAGISSIAVGANGQVRACAHTETEYGHILQEDLNIIWTRMSQWRDGSLIPPICRKCPLFARCGGGCRMDAKMKHGQLNALDPHADPSNINQCLEGLKQLPPYQPLPTELPDVFHTHPKLRLRLESFGSIVMIGRKCAAYLNHDATNLINYIRNNGVTTQSDMVATGFLESELFHFLPILIAKKILKGGENNVASRVNF